MKLLFKAVIFDMDGVITKTALTHSIAWKKMFDEYLKKREAKYGESFLEFTHANDYLPYVDGKPRYKGVQSFLESRDIFLAYGKPLDSPGTETICGLGNLKNLVFNEVLRKEGVEVFQSTVKLIQELKNFQIKLGVASSSKNCKSILERADLADIFDVIVDGVFSAEVGLHGKPEPDIFTSACDIIGIRYADAIVVEDAASGVQAGKKGNFGLTLGIARVNNRKDLEEAGADFVVEDLEEIGGIEGLNKIYLQFNS